MTLLIVLLAVLQTQGQFSIRAASTDPVAGWERMQDPDVPNAVWVSPIISLTGADIASARPATDESGHRIIAIVFTDAGANKMRDLTKAQMNRLIALVLDGKLIWAPRVRAESGKTGVLSGSGPEGLTPELMQRLLESIR